MRPIPEGYLRAKEGLETAVLDGSGGTAPEIAGMRFQEAREGFSEALERWQQNSGERETLIEALDEKRRVYEQRT